MVVQTWAEVTLASLQNIWSGVISFLPSLIGALIIIIIGLIVAAGLKSLVERLLGLSKIDSLLRQLGTGTYIERAGLTVNSGKFVGFLVYWFFVIVFFIAAADVLGLSGITLFLNEVVSYLPNIIVAVLIMLAAVLLAKVAKRTVSASVMGAKLHASKFLGAAVWWIVIVFGLLAALLQLGIATSIINALVTGFIAMLALAGGIAFGLGGKEYAAHLLEEFKRDTEGK